jgi:hypothetical protein
MNNLPNVEAMGLSRVKFVDTNFAAFFLGRQLLHLSVTSDLPRAEA